jgi:hypothetical protein
MDAYEEKKLIITVKDDDIIQLINRQTLKCSVNITDEEREEITVDVEIRPNISTFSMLEKIKENLNLEVKK